jgi:predicted O-methyltransferase YrrM
MEFTDIFPGSPVLDLQFEDFACRGGNVAFTELAMLAAIVKTAQPHTLFEFGTYDGNTTLQLALNGPDDAIVYTIDLPPDNLSPRLRLDPGDRIFMGRATVGQRFKGIAAERKIHQVLSDSAAYDYSFLEGKVDFVFVDGAHSYEYLKNDTQHALTMLAPKGLIVWHDYLVWNDVTDFLNRLSKSLPLIHLKGTSLVLFMAPR